MRKRVAVRWIFVLVLLFASWRAALAQAQTTVTATVTDPSGIPYSGGTVKAQINPPGPPSPCVVTQGNCVPIQGVVGPQPLDSTGSFTVNLYPNASITPAATTWIFTVCISPGVNPPMGTGPQCFSSAATIAGTSQSLTAQLSAAAPALAHSSLSLPMTLTAPGVFTNTQQNENFSVIVGSGCTPSSIFSTTQKGNFGTDGASGTICVPSSGVSNAFSSGIHGYASNAGATTGCAFGTCSAVAVAGDAISVGTGSPIWAGNFVAQTTSGDAAPIHAVEIDANAEQIGDSGEGLFLADLGTAVTWTTNGAFPGIRIGPSSGTTPKFSSGFYCDVGATQTFACLTAAASAAGNSKSSQTVEWDATNSSGATVAAAFQEQATGTLLLFGGGGILQLPHTTVSSLPSASTLGVGTVEIVTDAALTGSGSTCVGSGSITTIAVSNGSNWICQGGGSFATFTCSQPTIVTASAAVTTAQNLQACTAAIPAGTLNVLGRGLNIYTGGLFSTQTTAPTLTFSVQLCSVAGCGSGTVVNICPGNAAVTTGAVTSLNWTMKCNLMTTTTGTLGVLQANGQEVVDPGSLITAADNVYGFHVIAPTVIDLTAAWFIQVQVIFSNASTSNQASGRILQAFTLN